MSAQRVGYANAEELKELIGLVDYRIAKTQAVYDANMGPGPSDIVVRDVTWLPDWLAMKERYRKVRDLSDLGVSSTTSTYEKVARAVQQVEAHRTKGDLSDLMTRLGKLGYPVDESGTPQPSKKLSDLFMEATNVVPTPQGLETFTKWAVLLFLVHESGILKGILRRKG